MIAARIPEDILTTADVHALSTQGRLPLRGGSSTIKPRVLVAEDDVDVRALMRAFLEMENFDVFTVSDGARAYELFEKLGDIDLLLTDIQMPYVSGIELAAGVHLHDPETAVILMSAIDRTREELEAFSRRGWSFVAKPFRMPDMLATIQLRLRGRRRFAMPI